MIYFYDFVYFMPTDKGLRRIEESGNVADTPKGGGWDPRVRVLRFSQFLRVFGPPMAEGQGSADFFEVHILEILPTLTAEIPGGE